MKRLLILIIGIILLTYCKKEDSLINPYKGTWKTDPFPGSYEYPKSQLWQINSLLVAVGRLNFVISGDNIENVYLDTIYADEPVYDFPWDIITIKVIKFEYDKSKQTLLIRYKFYGNLNGGYRNSQGIYIPSSVWASENYYYQSIFFKSFQSSDKAIVEIDPNALPDYCCPSDIIETYIYKLK